MRVLDEPLARRDKPLIHLIIFQRKWGAYEILDLGINSESILQTESV